MAVWINNNGVLTEGEEIGLSFKNRGLNYGDGFFETLRFDKGQCFLLSFHLDRIKTGCELLGFENGTELLQQLPNEIEWSMRSNGMLESDARVKIQIFRQAGGTYHPSEHKAHFIISVSRRESFSFGLSQTIREISVCQSVKLSSHQPWTRLKSLSSQHYVMAALEQQRNGLDELVLINDQSMISEGVSSNIWWVKNEVVFTPALTTGCVAGVFRAYLLSQLHRAGVIFKEVELSIDALRGADEVFYTNAVKGICSVDEMNGIYFKSSFTHFIFEMSKSQISLGH